MVASVQAERDSVSFHYFSTHKTSKRSSLSGLVKISQEIWKLLRTEKISLYP